MLQISTNKNTRFDFQGFKNKYAKRNAVSFKSIWSGTFLPLFGELDLVSIVISNVNKSNHTYNEIYVSDKEMNIISILFKGDIKVIYFKTRIVVFINWFMNKMFFRTMDMMI